MGFDSITRRQLRTEADEEEENRFCSLLSSPDYHRNRDLFDFAHFIVTKKITQENGLAKNEKESGSLL